MVACFSVGSTECSRACMGPFEGSHHFLHYLHHSFSSLQFIRSVVSDSLQLHGLACQASLSIIDSRSLLKPMSTESVMPSNHLIPLSPPLIPLLPAFSLALHLSQHQSIFQ